MIGLHIIKAQTAGISDSFDKRWRVTAVVDVMNKHCSVYAAELT